MQRMSSLVQVSRASLLGTMLVTLNSQNSSIFRRKHMSRLKAPSVVTRSALTSEESQCSPLKQARSSFRSKELEEEEFFCCVPHGGCLLAARYMESDSILDIQESCETEIFFDKHTKEELIVRTD